MRCLPLIVWWHYVGSFAEGVLRGIDSSDTDVEGIAAVAGRDDDWLAEMLAKGFEDALAELTHGRDVLRGTGVVDVVGLSY